MDLELREKGQSELGDKVGKSLEEQLRLNEELQQGELSPQFLNSPKSILTEIAFDRTQ
jgi:ribosomal protein L29